MSKQKTRTLPEGVYRLVEIMTKDGREAHLLYSPEIKEYAIRDEKTLMSKAIRVLGKDAVNSIISKCL